MRHATYPDIAVPKNKTDACLQTPTPHRNPAPTEGCRLVPPTGQSMPIDDLDLEGSFGSGSCGDASYALRAGEASWEPLGPNLPRYNWSSQRFGVVGMRLGRSNFGSSIRQTAWSALWDGLSDAEGYSCESGECVVIFNTIVAEMNRMNLATWLPLLLQ